MLNKHVLLWLAWFVLSLSGCQTAPPKLEPEAATAPAQADEAGTKSIPKAALDNEQKPTAEHLSQQAMQSVKAGDIDKAIEQYLQIINHDPATAHAYTNLGLLYLHRQKPALARQAFEQAILVDNQDGVAYNNLAIIQRQSGEFKKALFNYYKAINANPDYANAHLNLGILFDLYLQDLPKALEQYEVYQQLTGNSDEKVKKWIVDIKRRIADAGAKK